MLERTVFIYGIKDKAMISEIIEELIVIKYTGEVNSDWDPAQVRRMEA